MLKYTNKKRGFALLDVILAISITLVISGIITFYYESKHRDENVKQITNQIISVTNLTDTLTKSGNLNYSINNTIKGYSLSSNKGITTVQSQDVASCMKILSELNHSGQVTNNCDVGNNIIFRNSVNTIASLNAVLLEAGNLDNSSTNIAINKSNMNSKMTLSLDSMSVLSESGKSISSSGSIYLGNGSLKNGNSSSLTSDSIQGNIVSTIVNPSVGSASLSCSYYLSNDLSYQTKSLGERTTPCSSGQVSLSNQIGTRTFSCPNPNLNVYPTSTDTWTGGSCSTECVVQAPQTRNVSCPSGYNGSEVEQRTSSCPTTTSSLQWSNWSVISTSGCSLVVTTPVVQAKFDVCTYIDQASPYPATVIYEKSTKHVVFYTSSQSDYSKVFSELNGSVEAPTQSDTMVVGESNGSVCLSVTFYSPFTKSYIPFDGYYSSQLGAGDSYGMDTNYSVDPNYPNFPQGQ